MAVYGKATFRNIPPGKNDPPVTMIGVIYHVDAGDSKSLYGYFSQLSGGIESHFFIRKDGHVEQYRDTKYEADANLHANSFLGKDGRLYGFISVETQGMDAGEWTPAQIAALKELTIWAQGEHPLIRFRRCPAWNEAGVGYHSMWGSPSQWTPVAKDCPGPDRIEQFNSVIVPWLATLSGGTGSTPSGPIPGELSVSEADRIIDYISDVRKDLKDTLTIWQEAKDNARQAALIGPLNALTATLHEFMDSETARYSDVANRVQNLTEAERGRYQDYVSRFTSVLGAVADVRQALEPAPPVEPPVVVPPKA